MARKKHWDVVLENQGLVGAIIKRCFTWALYKNSLVDFSDLYQAGLIGLYRAVKTYDPSTGYSLATYSYHWINQKIRLTLKNDYFKTIRIPVYQYEQMAKIIRKHGENKNIYDLYLNGEITEIEYDCFCMMQNSISLDKKVDGENEGEGKTIKEFLLKYPEEKVYVELEENDMRGKVERNIAKLTMKERDIIERRFGLNGYYEQTLKEAGNAHNLTRERVRQIQMIAIKKLRKYIDRNTIALDPGKKVEKKKRGNKHHKKFQAVSKRKMELASSC